MTKTTMRGRPARDGVSTGGYVAQALMDMALETCGSSHSTKTACYEEVIAKGLEVEAEIGQLPLVKVPGERGLLKVHLPPALWAEFDNRSGMSKTDRLVTLLYHGLGLHHAKQAQALVPAG